MKRLVACWNEYWFPQSSILDLSLCRILAVCFQLFWFFPSLSAQIALLRNNPGFIHPQWIIRCLAAIVPALFTPAGLTALHRVTRIAGFTALTGLFTRGSLFALALGCWILTAHQWSYGEVHHSEALFSLFLLALSMTPSGDCWSLDALIRRFRRAPQNPMPREVDTAKWPLKLAHVWLSFAYFSAGAFKLLKGGFAWLNGYTLQEYVFHDALVRNRPLGMMLAQHHALCSWLSFYTLIFELSFWVSLFLPRAAPLFFANALIFHVALQLTGAHGFFPHMALLIILIIFYDPVWRHTRRGRLL